MNKVNPLLMNSDEQKQLELRYAKDALDAKANGCKIIDPQLYRRRMKTNMYETMFYLILNNLFFIAFGIIYGVLRWTTYAMSLQ